MDKTTSAILILLIGISVAFAAALVLEQPPGNGPSADTGAGIPSPGTTLPAPVPTDMVTSGTVQAACRPLTITQTDGTDVSFPCMPQRIIAANADAAELLIGLGVADRIVGATDSTLEVPYIRNKIPGAVSIGDWQTPNIEQMLALRPDVVIAYSSYRPRNADQISAHNITIVTLDCYKLSTLASDARALGKLTGNSNAAEVYARTVEDTVAEVSRRMNAIPADKRPSVYFESYTDLTASAPGSGSDELLTGAGGKNIAAAFTTPSAKISSEWVVSQQPEFIFKAVSSTSSNTLPEVVTVIRAREGWENIPAIKNDRVYAFSNEILYGPRAYIGLVYAAQILHPVEFRDMHPRAMLADYDHTYVAGTNRTGLVYP